MALSAERLKALRERDGLTQEQVSAKAGISNRLYQKYEGGETDPSVENASKLADVFNTTLDYLAGKVADPRPYLQGDLSLVERIIIRLFRQRKLPETVYAELRKAANDDLHPPASS